MSRLFGGVSTDVVLFTQYAAMNNLADMTVAAWVYETGTGGGTKGRIMDKDPNDFLWYESGGSQTQFQAERWGTDGIWVYSRTLNIWQHHLVTYSYSSTANDPIAYINGATVTVTRNTAPVGSLSTPTTDLKIGNAATADRNWAGRLADLAIWNRILSDSEAMTVYRLGAWAVPNGRVFWAPLMGQYSPEPNYIGTGTLTGTVTGTALADQPPMPMPFQGRRRPVMLPSAPIPAATLGGTALASIDETDLVAGGKTLTITLAGGATWIAA